jgi:hypothetical protein
MLNWIRRLVSRISELLSLFLVFSGLLFGRSSKPERPLSVPERIAAIQQAVQQMPAEMREPFLLGAQWGNWGNWNNWNNWANWANFRNWNNWGNWANY